jgi:ABC-type glycerol-3-phosphate transport system permease component
MKKGKIKLYIKEKLPLIPFLIFLLYALSQVYVLVWGLMSSLKDPIEYVLYANEFFPAKPLFKNYIEAFELLNIKDTTMFGMIFNSLWVTIGSSLISMAVCNTTAYIVSKYEFVGKKVIQTIVIAMLMIPLFGSFASHFQLVLKLNLYDSPLLLVTSASGAGGMFLILSSYYKGVSGDYGDAARIDGANEFQIYVRIMIPIAWPAISAIFIHMLIGGWNDYTTSIYYLPSYPTLAAGLYLYKNKSLFNMNYPVYFAGIMMSCIPTFILFLVFQDEIMKNMSMGGLKG